MKLRAIGLLVLFGGGFLLARLLSSPAGEAERDGEGLNRIASPSAISDSGAAASSKVGFEGAVARELRRLQATAAGDFEALLRREADADERLEIVNQWVEADPAAVWAWMEAGGEETLGWNSPLSHLFEHWFKRDPDAAMAVSRQLGFRGRYFSSIGILRLLFTGDADTRAAVAQHIDELESSKASMPSGIGHAELAQVEALPDSSGKRWLRRELMTQWFVDDWKAATGWAASLTEERRLAVERNLLTGTAERYNWREDGGRLDWMLERLADGDFADLRSRVGRQLVDVMAVEDPGQALVWAEENLGGRVLVEAVARVVSEQASKDIDAAAEIVGSLEPGSMRQQAMYRLIEKWPEDDVARSVVWAMEFEVAGDSLGGMIWGRLGSGLAYHDPAEARRFMEASETLPKGYERSALHALMANEPAESLVWAESVGGDRGKQWRATLLSNWRMRDAEAAREWEARQ